MFFGQSISHVFVEHKSGYRDRKSPPSAYDIRSQKGLQLCEEPFNTNIIIKPLYQFLDPSTTKSYANASGISGHFSTTLTEVYPCFFLGCKENARV
jgi:hypothetical protein